MAIRSRAASVAIALALVVLIVPDAGASPAGNASAAKYYTQTVARLVKLTSVTQVITGDFFFGYAPGTWHLTWFQPKAGVSYEEPVKDTFVTVAKNGVIQWVSDTFSQNCGTTHGCNKSLVPMRFVVTKSAGYWGELTGGHSSPSCWVHASGITAWIKSDFSWTGRHVWYAGGGPLESTATVKPLVTGAHTITITASYTYTLDGQKATEVDTVAKSTGLITRAVITVAKGARSSEHAYKQVNVISKTKATPTVPSFNSCP